ncbi:flagellar biosynthesis protein FlhF [Spirochaetia bacterium]|nr:flagellar biosynthesis protein FlhF [Spirochaetia bacterium]
MEMFKEQAYTEPEVYQKIRSKWGPEADIQVMYRRENVPMGRLFGLFPRKGVELEGIVRNGYKKYTLPGTTPGIASAKTGGGLPPSKSGTSGGNWKEEAERIVAMGGKDPTLIQLLNEVKTIKDKIDETNAAVSSGVQAQAPVEHSTLTQLEKILKLNEFTDGYRKKILDRVRKEFSLDGLENFDAVQDQVIEWIGESIQIDREDHFQRRPRIFVLVGPTGVGKTTTIAKLAAIYGTGFTGQRPLSLRMITIDNYRIGAEHQIESYGEIMNIPVSSVKSYRELKEVIALNSEGVDMMLVDTMGRSPLASVELAEMKQLLDACGTQAEFHLALAASTTASTIEVILRNFEPFGYKSVLITKMDETIRLGNVLSVLEEKGKAVSYITEGQQVPKDIQKADVMRFLTNLEGFKINRMKFDKRFPSDETEQIQWRQ